MPCHLSIFNMPQYDFLMDKQLEYEGKVPAHLGVMHVDLFDQTNICDIKLHHNNQLNVLLDVIWIFVIIIMILNPTIIILKQNLTIVIPGT